ncbi:hypothetical protein BJV85_001221 [Clostridium acetobutylicum]|uniref:Uncharacterized protein n=1 Tax=Clostridium acetobutylicum (strain ATCC 824 / DSM 792 / JCM 1419 / IAM 19013 / LMG 5710 / NBRC 13948 / NRRL B-527 / VKM B-1787 / 2291 / W) TaxID=272562 RepID=Q97FQ9_CLOAB|nr:MULTISPECIES: hypothetical protein [Clostridium]AAK80615.1 Hypothetical protein CA_C2668 [Clostridium acetobutylicum ATCC 824]ADZ21714.1 Conserved hypothetical protein [Clostridium acetobutylicum EA 2018]AEI32492.1 hypothetical protein SMB_G2703 [Clostridium acetobutylicum DSM 1731]AWV78968.1 hypothetical protein DK921_02345 [Clostridium acetobutylicum]MBC2395208.1 hypothetical protein [Clostridium acetobutylicum]
MQIALEIAGLSAILIFTFIGIWSFILFHKVLSQLKYQNYLMEKLIRSLVIVSKSKDIESNNIDGISEDQNEENNL